MKTKIIFIIFFLLTNGFIYAQNKNAPRSIISASARIKKYHSFEELKAMQKGELLDLYVERIQVLVKILPYIALASKPGITITDIGIPNNSENKKTMQLQAEGTTNFLDLTVDFQKKMLPYSDKENLITAILFYENTMKTLHEYNEL